MKYSLWQRIKVRVLGKCYLEHRKKKGWSGALPFYLVRCRKHGYFENYPHGRGGFNCPGCLKELEARNDREDNRTKSLEEANQQY